MLTDEVEASESDDGWLRTALSVLPELDDVGSRQLLDVLRTLEQDYLLDAREAATIRRVVPQDLIAPDEVDASATPDELAAIMRSIVTAQLAYERALEGADEQR